MSVEWRKVRWGLAAIVAAIALSGCAPTIQGFLEETGEPRLDKAAVVMADGARLPLKVWRARRTRAVILALHGFNDYSNAFAMSAPWFRERGITVYAYDQRGFGRTDQPGIWAGSDVLVSDVRSTARMIARRHGNAPVYLLGVSMGGAVVMSALAGPGVPEASGAILVAPAVWGWRAMNPFYKSALWIASHSVPSMTATGRGLGVRPSDNIDMLRKLGADPLVIKKTRIDSIYGLVTLMDEAHDAAPNIKTPVLYLYGQNDELVPEDPTFEVARTLKSPRRFVHYKNGWHMLLRDKQRKKVWRDVAAWIRNRKAPLPSGEELVSLEVAANADRKLVSTTPNSR